MAYALLSAVQRRVPSMPGGLTILAYHLVDGGTASPVDIALTDFRAHLDSLAAETDVVSLGTAISRLEAGTATSGRPMVVITVDDAYDNFRSVLWPELRQRRMPATLYVPVGFVDGSERSPISDSALAPCSWDSLREMLGEGGLSIGSHTIRHPNLRRVPLDVAEREIRDSRRVLEDKLQTTVDSFCYPQAKWTPAVAALVATHYRSGVIAGGRQVRSASVRRERLPRLPVRREFGGDILRGVRAPVWLPEWVSDQVRQLRP